MITRSMKRLLSPLLRARKKSTKSAKREKKNWKRKNRIQSPARASFREIKRFRRRESRGARASRARLVLRWYIQRCMEGPFKTGIISERASKGRRSEWASGGGRQFPPSKRAQFSAVHGVQRARLRTSYVGSALNFPRARALSSGRK